MHSKRQALVYQSHIVDESSDVNFLLLKIDCLVHSVCNKVLVKLGHNHLKLCGNTSEHASVDIPRIEVCESDWAVIRF